MKNEILFQLVRAKGKYVSGQEIASSLHITRSAVSKHISQLRKEGYQIDAKTNKGYCLDEKTDVLNQKEIEKNISSFYHIDVVDETGSTNDVLKEKASVLPEGSVLIANQQTRGRGRNNRSFFSPGQNGIYLSIMLKPDLDFRQVMKITCATAVALAESIRHCYDCPAGIKWVNDILIDSKKVAGILCEASFEFNTQKTDYVVVGVGINVHSYAFPPELKDIAGCIEDFSTEHHSRNDLIADFLNRFLAYYQGLHKNTFLQPYRQMSCILGRTVTVIEPDQRYTAQAVGIDEDGHLIIQKGGSTYPLSSAEIHILPQ